MAITFYFMKVMCIDDTDFIGPGRAPHVGEICTVVWAGPFPGPGKHYGKLTYLFEEYTDLLNEFYFSQKYFAPLSNIDETKTVKNNYEPVTAI